MKRSHTADAAFLTYHLRDDSNLIQDILTSIAFLQQSGRDRITLVCPGKTAGLCMVAAAVSLVPSVLKIDDNFHANDDVEMARMLFIPGLLHAGGMDTVRALVTANGKRTTAVRRPFLLRVTKPDESILNLVR